MKIKKGDKVKVIAGKDKGKTGMVVHALPREEKVVVEGIAMMKRHTRGASGKVGRIVEKPRPIHVSNVALVSAPQITSAMDAPASPTKKKAKK